MKIQGLFTDSILDLGYNGAAGMSLQLKMFEEGEIRKLVVTSSS